MNCYSHGPLLPFAKISARGSAAHQSRRSPRLQIVGIVELMDRGHNRRPFLSFLKQHICNRRTTLFMTLRTFSNWSFGNVDLASIKTALIDWVVLRKSRQRLATVLVRTAFELETSYAFTELCLPLSRNISANRCIRVTTFVNENPTFGLSEIKVSHVAWVFRETS
ncbi:hypothetical protein [Tateyamaria sp. syn59]|uniref:hypothetical protein n=1 Tax=Tateyamaria sp. syn59 TaxID=2576942 RepID=UPI0011BF58F8|nr:hypothetical protein [Tateyamaria sp. syn59]